MHTHTLTTLIKRTTLYAIIILTVFLSAFGGANARPVHAQNAVQDSAVGVTVDISATQSSFGAAEDVMVHVSITNPGTQPIRLLKWFTPFDSSAEPLFEVTLDGQPAPYIGAIYKRTTPTDTDYITLAAGTSLTADINLGAFYNLSAAGNYSIRYNISSEILFLEDGGGKNQPATAGSLTSNTLGIYIEAHEIPQLTTLNTDLSAASGSTSFNSCSTTRQSELVSARAGASSYAADAVTYFNNAQSGPRYSTWFGAYNSTRYNTAKTHFSNIKGVIDTAAINFDCTCADSGVYAYVYPDQPYNVYLCGAFWSAPTTGTDSKAGTLIHELSHFTVLGGTDDFVYGQSAAKSLAISNPANAVMNADSHEYFAENNPSLETTNSGGGLVYSISGNAGSSGVILSYIDGTSKTATADGSGNYSFTIPSGWSGTVTPSKSGYNFTPANKQYSNVTSNQASQNYSAAGTVSSGTNLLLDPSFEAYTSNSPWAQTSTNFGTPLCTSACGNDGGTALPRTGNVWAWFGGTNSDESGSISQNVIFPYGGSATLKFYLWIGSAESGSDSGDTVSVQADGNTIFSANATQQSSYPGYTLVTLDVSPYANGLSHTIKFASTTTTQYVTFNIDDVSLTATGPANPPPPPTQTGTFTSVAVNDGWVLEYSEFRNTGGSKNSTYTYFRVGDNSADKQFVGFLHFDTSTLPDNAVITSATIRLKKQGLVGTDPFATHGNLLGDIRKPYFGSTAGLVAADFQAASNLQAAAVFSALPADSWYSGTLDTSGYSFINLAGPTQFRLRFALDDNDDRGNDFVQFFSGNYGTVSSRPQLVVQYYVP